MLNIAIIGTGNIAPAHVKSYLQFPDRAKIVAMVDIVPEKAMKMAEEYNLDARIFDSHQALIDSDLQIDLVSVATPPYTHAPISIDCMNNGVDVIVEKPMASSLAECDQMLKAATENRCILSVIAQNRFRTPMMKLKSILDTGVIGKVVHAQVDSYWWRGHCYYDLWWRGTWEKEGGGPTLNHAVHHIDLFQWMMGMPEEVVAVMGNVSHDNSEVEDISIATLRFANGSLGQITSSVVHHGEGQQLVFQGEKARISAPWKLYASVSMDNGFPERNTVLEQKIQDIYDKLPDTKHEVHTGQIDHVLTAILEKRPVLIDGVAGRQTIELITAIYKAASTENKVKLPLAKDDPFYTSEGIIKHAKHFYQKNKSVDNLGSSEITTGSDYR